MSESYRQSMGLGREGGRRYERCILLEVRVLEISLHTEGEGRRKGRIDASAQDRRERRRIADALASAPIGVHIAFSRQCFNKRGFLNEVPPELPARHNEVRVLDRAQIGFAILKGIELKSKVVPPGNGEGRFITVERLMVSPDAIDRIGKDAVSAEKLVEGRTVFLWAEIVCPGKQKQQASKRSKEHSAIPKDAVHPTLTVEEGITFCHGKESARPRAET